MKTFGRKEFSLKLVLMVIWKLRVVGKWYYSKRLLCIDMCRTMNDVNDSVMPLEKFWKVHLFWNWISSRKIPFGNLTIQLSETWWTLNVVNTTTTRRHRFKWVKAIINSTILCTEYTLIHLKNNSLAQNLSLATLQLITLSHNYPMRTFNRVYFLRSDPEWSCISITQSIQTPQHPIIC